MSKSEPVNLYSTYLITGLKIHVLKTDFHTVPQNIGTLQVRVTSHRGAFHVTEGAFQPWDLSLDQHVDLRTHMMPSFIIFT